MMKIVTNYAMLSALVFAATAFPADAQWTVTNLHPAPAGRASESCALAVADGQQVGYVVDDFWLRERASVWEGTAASWVNLHPPGITNGASLAYGVGGGVQVGHMDWTASLWSGSVASWQNVNPPGNVSSHLYSGNATRQAGFTSVSSDAHAAIRPGAGVPWIDLHPAGVQDSYVYGDDGLQQAGSVKFVFEDHRASVWSNTAASWVDLHPAGATRSEAFDVDKGQQVGFATVGGTQRASLWTGTAGSWVDLNPAGLTKGIAHDVFDGYQVGTVDDRACMWTGTAASFEDLSLALPGTWLLSEARGVWHDGTTLFVVGRGFSGTNIRWEALMWSRPLETCYADCDKTTGNGVLDIFDFLCFQDSFVNGETYACDCDTTTGVGVCDIFDFLCFQDAFVGGCP